MPNISSIYKIKTRWIGIGICFFLSSYSAFSQVQTKLKGKITADSGLDFQVNIINLSQHTGTISQKDGSFEVAVDIGDELIFTAMGYENYQLKVTDSILENAPIDIKLEEAVNFLEEVKISGNNLTGDLKKDAAKVDYFDQTKVGIPFSKKRKFTQAERRIYAASTGSIDLLYSVISGKMKVLKRMREYEKIEEQKENIQSRFEEEFFVQELNVPKELIENFLYYCLDFIEENAQLEAPFEMIEFLKNKAKDYRISMNLN